jgi:hypothetical protein
MPIPQIQPLNQDADLEQVKNYVIRMERTLNFLLENGLDSENVFEVGGWRVGSDTLSSKDGDVGMTTAGTSGSSIRLWAGSTDPNTAPWRISRAGTSYMTGAEIYNELTGGAYTSIGSNGITINDGSMDTFRADIYGKVTMTSALIQSSAGYPRVVMDPNGKLFSAELNPDNFIRIVANYSGAPALEVWSGGVIKGRINTLLGVLAVEGYSGLTVSSYGSTDLRSANEVLVPKSDWSGIVKEDGLSLQDEFDELSDVLAGKAISGVSTSLSGSANGGIPVGTVLMVSGGGTVTWNGIPLHSHAQI